MKTNTEEQALEVVKEPCHLVTTWRIPLGALVKDVVTGLTGVAVCRSEWLNGCIRVVMQPQELKEGKPADVYVVDQEQLKIVKERAVAITAQPTGGPMPDAVRANIKLR